MSKLSDKLKEYSFADLHALRDELEKAITHNALSGNGDNEEFKKAYKLDVYICHEIGERLRMLKMYV